MTITAISKTTALKTFLSQTSDHHLLTDTLRFVADRLVALDADKLCGAGVLERSGG